MELEQILSGYADRIREIAATLDDESAKRILRRVAGDLDELSVKRRGGGITLTGRQPTTEDRLTTAEQIALATRDVCDGFEAAAPGDFNEGLCSRCGKQPVWHWLRDLWEERRARIEVARNAPKPTPELGSGPWVK